MVDYYGKWTYNKRVNPRRMCDMDYVAQLVDQDGYEPVTSMENIVSVIVLLYNGYLMDHGVSFYSVEPDDDELHINADDVAEFIEDNGGFSEFDYYTNF
ncbi:hypothetical protein IJ556_07530 [bacterium]|nr:hypothetical protein [bacterium]